MSVDCVARLVDAVSDNECYGTETINGEPLALL